MMDVSVRVVVRRRRSGVRVFYVTSFTRRRTEYTVQRVRRPGQHRWTCTCPNFFHTQSVRRRHCKHIRLLRDWLERIGGLWAAKPGVVVTAAPSETPRTLFKEA